MTTLTQIYDEILLREQNRKMAALGSEDNWKPERCTDYSPPEFHIPECRAKAAQRRKLSKVLSTADKARFPARKRC